MEPNERHRLSQRHPACCKYQATTGFQDLSIYDNVIKTSLKELLLLNQEIGKLTSFFHTFHCFIHL
jgi:hypothetical protein